MSLYNRYIVTMDVDSIVSIFSPDGSLGAVAHGKDSIRAFLNRYKEFKVLSQQSSTNLISLAGDSAVQEGNYWQTTVIPPQDTVHVRGTYVTKWIWTNEKGWKIKNITTHAKE